MSARSVHSVVLVLAAAALIAVRPELRAAEPRPALAIDVRDVVVFPMTGKVNGTGQTDGLLARVTSVREEPGGRGRFFANDLNGPLYIYDRKTQKLTTYLDFNGKEGRPGLFRKLAFEAGWANGLNSFQFDPDYPRNGTFYTVHLEDFAVEASEIPNNAHTPGLKLDGYQPTPAIPIPGPSIRDAVLIQWTDSNPSNTTFEGTAREILRMRLNTRIHPLGDLTFNPSARPGDADWRVMYVGCGDGGAGESSRPDTRSNPQRLDTLVGKIWRIIPDPAAHTATSTISDNGRYRIPNDNPFVKVAGARKEIWALGLRNPHRLNWGVDPSNPRNLRLIANSIGLRTWETVNIIHRGANYGYSLREGNEALEITNRTTALPDVDEIPVQVSDTVTAGTIRPTYPVIQYGHVPGGGDAIGSGFVYRGKRLPALRGKYVFSDITTGRLWYSEYADMLRADDGDPKTMAPMHEIHVLWDDPADTPDAGRKTLPTMYPIVSAAYRARGGADPNLPGRGNVAGDGRVDVHFAVDAAGELYLFSKTDGMLREVIAVREVRDQGSLLIPSWMRRKDR